MAIFLWNSFNTVRNTAFQLMCLVILDGSVSSFVTESLKRCGQSGTFSVTPACPHNIYRTAPRQNCSSHRYSTLSRGKSVLMLQSLNFDSWIIFPRLGKKGEHLDML